MLKRIGYKPISVREVLEQIKDNTGLMLDLAYYAFISSDKDIAEVVLQLEKDVDYLSNLLLMSASLAVRDPKDAEEMLSLIKIALASDKISNAAADIANLPLIGITPDPAIKEALNETDEVVKGVRVEKGSPLIGKKVGDIKPGIDVIALKTDRVIVVNPDDEEKIGEGTYLIVRGQREVIEGVKEHREAGVKTFAVKDYIVKLKDTAELMVDLAYTSVLLNSKEIAEEVAKLENYVDELHKEFELTVLRKREVDEKGMLSLIRFAIAIEQIADAAFEIAELVLRGLPPHPLLARIFEETEETLVKVKVKKDSSIAGKTVGSADLEGKVGFKILAIRRGRKWIINPGDDVEIKEGDVLILKGFTKEKIGLLRFISPR